MSVLREMAEEVAKRLGEDVDFFLVVQTREGKKEKVVLTNVDMPVVDARKHGEVVNG